MNGELRKINVVRLGRSDAINANVQDVTLEELVKAILDKSSGQNEKQRAEIQALMKDHQQISAKLRVARENLEANETKQTKENFEVLRRQKTHLSNQIDNARDKEKNMVRQVDLERKKAQQAILDSAHVICATLSGSGHDMFQNLNIEFETVVVDEAAQCVEASALIPLKYGCAKCILVGDPKQLPPTVFSKEASRFQYEQSLFVRLQMNAPTDVHLLDTQYRMHPEISQFPSTTFYDGRLLDGPGMDQSRKRPWHSTALLGPYRFFDVQGQHQAAPKGHSLINIAEIEVALHLYDRLTNDFSDVFDFNAKVGIITPYKSQLAELKSRFILQYGQIIQDNVEFNTTDAFQGRECDVIIFSCVRASPSGGVGFLRDIRRMNVGLTRAKSSLWVLGNSSSLMRGEFWGKLIEDAKARGRFSQGNYMQTLKKPIRHEALIPVAVVLPAVIHDTAAYGTDGRPPMVTKRTAGDNVVIPESSESSNKNIAKKLSFQETNPRAMSSSSSSVSKSSFSNGHKAIESKDVEMKDISDEMETSSKTPKSDLPPLVRNGIFGARLADRPVIKKVKRPPANPLVQPNRTKKPKPS
jgi:senataxin